ncbi:Crp/Fnr family transcriptional regulator, partial [bacterium]
MIPAENIQSALKKIPWFNSLTPEHFQKTAELTHLRHAKAGETFFREGDKQDYV